jgi:hypothetical protein
VTTRRARRGLRLAARLFVGAVVGTLAGMTVAIVTSSGTVAGPPEPPAGRPLPAAAFTTRERVDVVDRQAPQPRRITIRAIGLSAPVVPLGLNPDGTMQVPSNTVDTGWFRPGPEPGERGPAGRGLRPDLLFVDGSHERDSTIATFEAWRGALAGGAVVVFHDYGNPAYPGVEEAVEALGLDGAAERDVFVWRAP